MYHELGSLHLARDSENTSCLSHFISTCSSGYEIMALKNFAYLQPDLVFKSRTSLKFESMEHTFVLYSIKTSPDNYNLVI